MSINPEVPIWMTTEDVAARLSISVKEIWRQSTRELSSVRHERCGVSKLWHREDIERIKRIRDESRTSIAAACRVFEAMSEGRI